jgi:hypothetical protein
LAAAFNGLAPGAQRLFAAWVALTTIVLFAVCAAPRSTHDDFVAFYCAGQAIVTRADPYREMPLNRCERAVTSGGPFSTGITIPAPLPGYALVPFALLSLLDFQTAFWLFTAGSFLAAALGCFISARSARAPLILAVALAAPTVWDNWLKGQPVTFSFLALALAGLLVARGRDRWAALAALGTLVQPQVGLAVCVSLALRRPRTRLSLTAGFAVLIGASVVALSPSILIEYVRDVLPLQARSEASWLTQISAVSPLVAFGVPLGFAIGAAAVQQVLVTVAGIFGAGKVARACSAPELIVFFPALAAAIGGAYEHTNVLLIVLPAGLVLAPIAGKRFGSIVLCAAMMPWLALGEVVPAALIGCSLFTVAVLRGVRWQSALLGPAACALLCVGAVQLEAMPNTPLHINHIDAHAYAEASWSLFVQAKNPPAAALRAVLALKVPTWLSLAILFAVALRAGRHTGTVSPSSRLP